MRRSHKTLLIFSVIAIVLSTLIGAGLGNPMTGFYVGLGIAATVVGLVWIIGGLLGWLLIALFLALFGGGRKR